VSAKRIIALCRFGYFIIQTSTFAFVSRFIRGNAVAALGIIGAAEAIPVLIEALDDRDGFVQGLAIVALGKMGDRATEPLIAALDRGSTAATQRVAKALGMIGDERAVELLIGLLGDADGFVRGNAAEALGNIGDVRAASRLIAALADDAIFEKVAEALACIGEPAVEPLTKTLNDPNLRVRCGAAEDSARRARCTMRLSCVVHLLLNARDHAVQLLGLTIRYFKAETSKKARDMCSSLRELAKNSPIKRQRLPSA
jgi:HEAT repeat protein